jgi:hypothetical protein
MLDKIKQMKNEVSVEKLAPNFNAYKHRANPKSILPSLTEETKEKRRLFANKDGSI